MTIAGKPDPESTPFVVAEYARAMLGQKVQTVVSTTGPNVKTASARELRYWEALTAVAQKDYARALLLTDAALSVPAVFSNTELRWRLEAVSSSASQRLQQGTNNGATMRARATTDFDNLRSAWTTVAPTYFARPDLVALRQRLS